MIYELRIYHAMPGKLEPLVNRFRDRTIKLWEKHGIRQAGFWTTLIGQSHLQLTYFLVWESLADREHRWAAFLADPAWHAIERETEKDGPLVQNILSELMLPTEFSSVK